MADLLAIPLKISIVIFMAGNLFDMGLRLDPQEALRGLRNARFVALALIWGFILGPAIAYAITRIVPLEYPYAIGLILLGVTPCAPFLPLIVEKAKGDLGYCAAFMVLSSVGMVLFMPFAVPLMVQGLTATAWSIAKPLVMFLLAPLAIGMAILHASVPLASRILPSVKMATTVATLSVIALCIVVYGKGLLAVASGFAVASQLFFFCCVTALPYLLGFGLRNEQKIVLSTGMATRNLGRGRAAPFRARNRSGCNGHGGTGTSSHGGLRIGGGKNFWAPRGAMIPRLNDVGCG
jgi:BASS family bile acid:Na+ symporter